MKFKNESIGICCANGKVKLPVLNPPTKPILTLISGTTSQPKHFLLNIRAYNSCFQMTSFVANNSITDNFMPTLKVQGHLYHRAGSLLPLPENEYKFLQIYFMGHNDIQIDQRCTIHNEVKREIIASLQELF